ncbi:MAG: hypothetical protein IKN21_04660 [Prevotella sp.]|nr:hypothetical protein [Prevotella sp.]
MNLIKLLGLTLAAALSGFVMNPLPPVCVSTSWESRVSASAARWQML